MINRMPFASKRVESPCGFLMTKATMASFNCCVCVSMFLGFGFGFGWVFTGGVRIFSDSGFGVVDFSDGGLALVVVAWIVEEKGREAREGAGVGGSDVRGEVDRALAAETAGEDALTGSA